MPTAFSCESLPSNGRREWMGPDVSRYINGCERNGLRVAGRRSSLQLTGRDWGGGPAAELHSAPLSSEARQSE